MNRAGADAGDGDVRLTVIVRGRVQGVGYRAFAIDRARQLGIVGYVRNLPDGRTVEAVAEGPRETLERFVDHLRRGPYAARVDDVAASWGPAIGNLDAFEPRV